MTQTITPGTGHITTSGGLLTDTFIANIRELNSSVTAAKPETFPLPWQDAPSGPAALEEQIATAWDLLCERWDAVHNDLDLFDISQLRQRWLLPLFDLLDFNPAYQRGTLFANEDEELRFQFSHRGWAKDGSLPHPPVLHTVQVRHGLDERHGRGAGIAKKSPHDQVQLFLNASRDDQWALLTNGRFLRLLRDYHHTFTKGYVEFDLEGIFESRAYADFRALYRLCHASRFVPLVTASPSTDEDENEEAIAAMTALEQSYKDALATGIRVGEDLRQQVVQAIETLGNGFLRATPTADDQQPLYEQLAADTSASQALYSDILTIIYRILFMLFAEQKGMLPRDGAPLEELYRQAYSITALADKAARPLPADDDHTDLWEGLQVTFQMLNKGADELGVFGYNGMLFDISDTRYQCPNSALLQAVRSLTLIARDGGLQRISYADLGVEEIGSIYESLLDYTPRVTAAAEEIEGREIAANTFYLDPRGLDRKTSGSYYTHPSLVNELIKSALLPVARQKLAEAGLPVIDEEAIGEATTGLLRDYSELSEAEQQAGADALLSMSVCDPAAGSGHFLVRANNVLGAELARIRTGEEYPPEQAVQQAKRDVLAHCIYAVDLNRMAVELCRVALWINASVPDKPLNFLNHHIRHGNSLVGVTPQLLEKGLPKNALALGITGDDRDAVKEWRKVHQNEWRTYQKSLKSEKEKKAIQPNLFAPKFESMEEIWNYFEPLEDLALTDPNRAKEEFDRLRSKSSFQDKLLEANTWCAAFFWPMTTETNWVPTFNVHQQVRNEGSKALPHGAEVAITQLAKEHYFFHWHLEFPQIFGDDGSSGFDVILGNPPWERIKLQEKEFFAGKDATVANARNAAQRRKLIRALPAKNPTLHEAFMKALRKADAQMHFLRSSERYPLTAVGDINTYQVFAGLGLNLVNPTGRSGMILPSGIATDYYNKDYFEFLIKHNRLICLYDFENRTKLFPEVDTRFKFALMTLMGSKGKVKQAEFAFFLTQVDQLKDSERKYQLTSSNLEKLNPITKTCPVFRYSKDARLTIQLHKFPIFDQDGSVSWNPNITTLFHMANDSELFVTYDDNLVTGSFAGNSINKNNEIFYPLYEGKMFNAFNHRAATVVVNEDNWLRKGQSRESQTTELQNSNYYVLPQYWIHKKNQEEKLDSQSRSSGFIAYKAVTSPTNERTMICAWLPYVSIHHNAPVILTEESIYLEMCLLANLNSFTLDYIVRNKVQSNYLSFFYVRQLPMITKDVYIPNIITFIVPRVLELTYTAWDLAPFAQDLWQEATPTLRTTLRTQYQKNETACMSATEKQQRWATHQSKIPHPPFPPFMWDDARRLQLRCELDALYAHLYGLTADELAYILKTFPIVKRKDEARFGEYRTKRLILENFERQVWEG